MSRGAESLVFTPHPTVGGAYEVRDSGRALLLGSVWKRSGRSMSGAWVAETREGEVVGNHYQTRLRAGLALLEES